MSIIKIKMLGGSLIGGGGGQASSAIIIVVLLVAALIGFFIYQRKKKGKVAPTPISSRQNKDEVWKTIKQYLKDNSYFGEEIVNSFVAKRNPKDYINPNDSRIIKKMKKQQIKELEKQEKEISKKNKVVKKRDVDTYVVCFTTKNTKTGILNDPRAFECQVINTRISKKETDRKIVITRTLNYNEEQEWIAPLQKIEHNKNLRVEKKKMKLIMQERKKLEKLKQKNKKKREKGKNKENA